MIRGKGARRTGLIYINRTFSLAKLSNKYGN